MDKKMFLEDPMLFGEVLLQLQMINQHQLNVALKEQEYNRKSVGYAEPIGNIMLRNGIITEEEHAEALLHYFKILSETDKEPAYVRETAKVAYEAIRHQKTESTLSEETKMIILRTISEYEERISQLEKSISTLSKMEQKKVIVETVEKEKKEIEKLIKKIEIIKEDLEHFS